MEAVKHDRSVVGAFVDHLRRNGMPDVKVDQWLEDEFPGTSQIEALVGPFAVEHTSIDTFANQRRIGDWFARVVSPLEQLFLPALTSRVRVWLPLAPFSQPGRDWSALQMNLARCVAQTIIDFPDGQHAVEVPGSDVTIRISVDPSGEPALMFWGELSDDESLRWRLRKLVERKATKLAPYSAKGKLRVLLLESVDGVTMNQHVMLDAVRQAFDRLPDGIDQLWFVDGARGLAPKFFDFTSQLN